MAKRATRATLILVNGYKYEAPVDEALKLTPSSSHTSDVLTYEIDSTHGVTITKSAVAAIEWEYED